MQGKMIIYMRKIETRSLFLTLYKNQFRVNKNLNRTETLKLIEENIGETLQDNNNSNDFFFFFPFFLYPQKHRKQKQKETNGIISN